MGNPDKVVHFLNQFFGGTGGEEPAKPSANAKAIFS